MIDPTYSGRPLISREADRVQAGLTAAGATVTGRSVSAPDEMGDVAWEAPEDGTRWMCVISPLDAALWAEWTGNDAPAAGDAEMAGPPPAPPRRWRDAEMDEPGGEQS
jgi:hypothetical protein